MISKVILGLIMALGSPDFYVRELAEWVLTSLPAAYTYSQMRPGLQSWNCEIRARSHRVSMRHWHELNVIKPGYRFKWNGLTMEVVGSDLQATTYRNGFITDKGSTFNIKCITFPKYGTRNVYEHTIVYVIIHGHSPAEHSSDY